MDVGGAVVEGVEAAEARDGLCDDTLNQLGSGHVHVHRSGRAAAVRDRSGHCLGALERNVRDGDRRALSRHGNRTSSPHPGPPAYHERDLALQAARIHRSSFASW
jgi:hypothetical protein